MGIETHSSADYEFRNGELRRTRKQIPVRGLNRNHNPALKSLFKGAALLANTKPGPLQDYYQGLLAKDVKPAMDASRWRAKSPRSF